MELTGNLPGTQWELEARVHRQPPETHLKPHLKERASPLPRSGVYNTFYSEMKWETSRLFLVLYNGCSSERTTRGRYFRLRAKYKSWPTCWSF